MKILWGKIEKMDGLTAPLCLMWTIWKQKNKWAFINVEHSSCVCILLGYMIGCALRITNTLVEFKAGRRIFCSPDITQHLFL